MKLGGGGGGGGGGVYKRKLFGWSWDIYKQGTYLASYDGYTFITKDIHSHLVVIT